MWWVPSPRPLLLCRRILGRGSCQGWTGRGPAGASALVPSCGACRLISVPAWASGWPLGLVLVSGSPPPQPRWHPVVCKAGRGAAGASALRSCVPSQYSVSASVFTWELLRTHPYPV